MSSDESKEVIDVEVVEEVRKDLPPVFLTIADKGEAFDRALDYALALANKNEGRVGIFHAISDEEFQHWAGVEDQLYQELREQAEKFIYHAAKKVEEVSGKKPALYIPKGNVTAEIVKTAKEDEAVVMIVLGSGSVSLASSLMDKVSVPVCLVPEKIEVPAVTAV